MSSDEYEYFEDDYGDEIREELSVQVASLFDEILNRKPLPKEEDLLSSFIDIIYSSDSLEVSNYDILGYLSEFALGKKYIIQGEKEYIEKNLESIKTEIAETDDTDLTELTFMNHFYNLLYFSQGPEDREELLEVTSNSLGYIHETFGVMDKSELRRRVENYEKVITQWYLETYPNTPKKQIRVDSLPSEKKGKVIKKTLDLLDLLQKSRKEDYKDDVLHLLHCLSMRFNKYVF